MRQAGTYLVSLIHLGIYIAVALTVITVDTWRRIKRINREHARQRDIERQVREQAKNFETELDGLLRGEDPNLGA